MSTQTLFVKKIIVSEKKPTLCEKSNAVWKKGHAEKGRSRPKHRSQMCEWYAVSEKVRSRAKNALFVKKPQLCEQHVHIKQMTAVWKKPQPCEYYVDAFTTHSFGFHKLERFKNSKGLDILNSPPPPLRGAN
jgi:hypothetical protein